MRINIFISTAAALNAGAVFCSTVSTEEPVDESSETVASLPTNDVEVVDYTTAAPSVAQVDDEEEDEDERSSQSHASADGADGEEEEEEEGEEEEGEGDEEEEDDEDDASTQAPSMDIITMTTPFPGHASSGSSESRCTAEERAVWIDNREFGDAYQQAAAKAWGDSADTVENLAPSYPQVSRGCLTCLGDATECGRTNCFTQCIMDQTGEGCRGCIQEHCIPTLLTCTGAATTSELPMAPRVSITTARPSSRTRPATLANLQTPVLRAASSDSELSPPGISGPGRLRSASDSNHTTDEMAERGRIERFNPIQFLGENGISIGAVVAFIAMLYAIARTMW
jgi:hypothetical protein